MQYRWVNGRWITPLRVVRVIHLGYLGTDISGIDQASSFHISHTFAIIHRHIIHANFYVI